VADEWESKLDTYLDGELPAGDMRALDAHIRACARCAAAVMNRVQVKRAVKDAGERFVPSNEFRERIAKSMAGRQRANPGVRWSWVVVGAMAVVLLIGAAWTYRGRQSLQQTQLYGELADLHVATLASANPIDVVSSDRHTVKPWFQGKIPFTFNLPELAGTEFTLVGGRMTYLHQTPGAQLIYLVRKHEISVFIFQDRIGANFLGASLPATNRLSFSMESWSEGNLRYFVVGDAATADIERLSDLLKKTKS
jgi:anti-sigma factor RsiW